MTRPAFPLDLTAPGAIDQLLAAHRSVFGDVTMTAGPADPPPPGGGDETPPAGEQPPAGGAGGAGGDGTPPADTGKTFTQADLDRIVGERIAAEKARHDKALKDATDLAGKSELEKAQALQQAAEERAAERERKAAERAAQAEAKVAALAAGAKPDRVAAVLKVADLTGAVDDDGNVDEAKIKAAIDATLTEYPEWKGGTNPAAPPASGGEAPKGGEAGPSFTREQIAKMSPEERAANIDKINEALAAGRITG